MTRLVAVVAGILAAALSACAPSVKGTPPAGSALGASIIEPYLKIHEALAKDSKSENKSSWVVLGQDGLEFHQQACANAFVFFVSFVVKLLVVKI